jgi:hypothetical protein
VTEPPPRREPGAPSPSDLLPPDEEFARTYAAGYEEGVRSALREMLGHASRGHTATELRMLVESRLARLSEEVEQKRRNLVNPPRRSAWEGLLRPPAPPRGWVSPVGAPASAPPLVLEPGHSVLVREARPDRALAILRANAGRFPRTATVSLRPPEIPGLAPDRRVDILAAANPAEPGSSPPTPGEISGRLRDPTAAGGTLVYVDALELLVTEHSLETTLRFVHWLVSLTGETGAALLVSFDPRSLDLKDASRLERAFETVV